jgi:hypothetical protein
LERGKGGFLQDIHNQLQIVQRRYRFGNVDFDDLMTLLFSYSLREDSDMLFEEALAAASRDEGFKATVYAMNTLLIHKGVYTQDEFQALFIEWVEKEQKRRTPVARRAEASSAISV